MVVVVRIDIGGPMIDRISHQTSGELGLRRPWTFYFRQEFRGYRWSGERRDTLMCLGDKFLGQFPKPVINKKENE